MVKDIAKARTIWRSETCYKKALYETCRRPNLGIKKNNPADGLAATRVKVAVTCIFYTLLYISIQTKPNQC